MSYQALARKWRPKSFTDHLIGQEHVVVALQHALTQGRLHHAYLLTGTRGVGKTTLARILAKALNCETGVTADPCGVCAACVAIDAGRFPDLLELDAASNTGVDQMREVLDNARYAPTSGRYKVYLIDEVHMLSRSAFNSMLKTLEEPPEHVKFILATTDPQKIPVTVLSRCLQFNLKPIPAALIQAHLATILAAEQVSAEVPALTALAKAARGSLRDALSLLDQAIAFGAGSVQTAVVQRMLGSVDRGYLYRVVEALADGNGSALMEQARQLEEHNGSGDLFLQELAKIFHQLAIGQRIPEALVEEGDAEEREFLTRFLDRFSETELQLYYQIALQGRADLPLAPDDSTGLGMTLLRLLAFMPLQAEGEVALSGRPGLQGLSQSVQPASTPLLEPPIKTPQAVKPYSQVVAQGRAAFSSQTMRETKVSLEEPQIKSVALIDDAAGWAQLVRQLNLPPMASRLALESQFLRQEGSVVFLALPEEQRHLAERNFQDKLKQALSGHVGQPMQLDIQIVAVAASPAAQARDDKARAEEAARQALLNDPFVQVLQREAGAELRLETVRSVDRG